MIIDLLKSICCTLVIIALGITWMISLKRWSHRRSLMMLTIASSYLGGFGCVFKGWIEENGTVAVKPGMGLTVAVKTLNHDGLQGHKEWLHQKRRQELTHTTSDHPLDDKAVYYKVAGDCPIGCVYSLRSFWRKKRIYVDPNASTSRMTRNNLTSILRGDPSPLGWHVHWLKHGLDTWTSLANALAWQVCTFTGGTGLS
ncbi:hypothetical protein Syun_014727 [Stephania yunnanensis]|uniref:Uncharacterized protein n=1 Tax=Stephania yunnanensis TaxID=152371 RepID=A0AAP0P927_9MAGN